MAPNEYYEEIRDYLKNHPELRKQEYSSHHPLSGHCYVASESYFHLNGGYSEFDVYRIKHEGDIHWFLKNNKGEIIDLTDEQFDTEVPYEKATKTGFLTKEPSKRAETVIEAVS